MGPKENSTIIFQDSCTKSMIADAEPTIADAQVPLNERYGAAKWKAKGAAKGSRQKAETRCPRQMHKQKNRKLNRAWRGM